MAAKKPQRNMRQNLNVRVEGMMELDNIDAGADRVTPVFLDRAGARFRQALVDATPKRSGRMAAKWRHVVNAGDRTLTLVNDHPGAKAQDRGAFIKPKRRRVLRFSVDGGDIFTSRPVRLPARQFSRKGLRGRGRIMQEEFRRAMDDLAQGRI